MNKSTKEFENQIKSAQNWHEMKKVLSDIPKINFGAYLNELCRKKNIGFSKLQMQSGVSRSLFYAITNGTRAPGKSTVIKIAFALKLNLNELNELLKIAGHKELYAKNRDEAIIIFGIQTGKSIEEIEELLIEENASLHIIDKD